MYSELLSYYVMCWFKFEDYFRDNSEYECGFSRSIGNHGLWNLNPATFTCVHRCFLTIRTIAVCRSMLVITELLCFCVFHWSRKRQFTYILLCVGMLMWVLAFLYSVPSVIVCPCVH